MDRQVAFFDDSARPDQLKEFIFRYDPFTPFDEREQKVKGAASN